MNFIQAQPQAMNAMPFILAKTLGREMGSANLATLWGLLNTLPKHSQENASRAGFTPGPTLGEEIFQSLLDHPEGIWIGQCDTSKNLDVLRTEDGRINIEYPEIAEWIQSIDAASEASALDEDQKWPLILVAGRRTDMNANTLMRDPSWNKDRRACTLSMNPEDAGKLGLQDGQSVSITTEAGSVKVELEVTGAVRPGQVMLPHGFGLDYEGEVYGANVNRLTKNTHRDKLAGTPLHRFVPCRVEAA
jgi:anaerobic selenocysteine-containing dehydrogenase